LEDSKKKGKGKRKASLCRLFFFPFPLPLLKREGVNSMEREEGGNKKLSLVLSILLLTGGDALLRKTEKMTSLWECTIPLFGKPPAAQQTWEEKTKNERSEGERIAYARL